MAATDAPTKQKKLYINFKCIRTDSVRLKVQLLKCSLSAANSLFTKCSLFDESLMKTSDVSNFTFVVFDTISKWIELMVPFMRSHKRGKGAMLLWKLETFTSVPCDFNNNVEWKSLCEQTLRSLLCQPECLLLSLLLSPSSVHFILPNKTWLRKEIITTGFQAYGWLKMKEKCKVLLLVSPRPNVYLFSSNPE